MTARTASPLHPFGPRPDPEALAAFLHDCLVEWIDATLRAGLPASRIAARLSRLDLCDLADHAGEITIRIDGISGTAPSLHGALRDWIDQARTARKRGPHDV